MSSAVENESPPATTNVARTPAPIETIPQLASFIPSTQRSFTSIIESFIPSYNAADTEIRKTNVRFQRKDAVARYVAESGGLRFQGWAGQIESLKTESDGEASVSVKLSGSQTIIRTWNNSFSDSDAHTMISRNDALYQSLVAIKKGDEVTVSGTFLLSDNQSDYIKESSLTEAGSMTTPEFLVRFSEIKVGLPVPTHGDQVTDKPNPALSPSEEPNNESTDRGLREDGRVYSVALIVAAPEISPGAKLFAQGRVSSFDYAGGVRSRRFAIIEDEQQPGKMLMCAMPGGEGAEGFSLYHVGEVVAVSGEYLDTAGYNGYPRVALTDCHMAGRQNSVVRPAEVPHATQAASIERAASVTTQSSPPAARPLQLAAGVRLLIHIASISRQPDGNFKFRGTLLQPAADLAQGTVVAGAGTVSGENIAASVSEIVFRGADYALKNASGANAPTGSGPAVELTADKTLEMWFSSASVYEKTTGIAAAPDAKP
jgi:hypothetical protein